MKRLHLIILLIVSVIAFNCQKESSYSGPGIPGTGNNSKDPITATLQGNVIDENGRPAIGVSINVGIKTVTTDARGYFRISNAALDKSASLVTAEKAGYFKAYRVFNATSGVNQVAIQLIKKTSAGSIDASGGGNVSLANGSKIALPANGVMKASGGAYSGSVKVFAAYIDPSDPAIAQTVPGSFLANDKDGNRVILTSYGMLAVELESPSGEKLQIATGKTATLTTAIPNSLQSTAPATIKLWSVDEQTGIWKEEGTATRNGNVYVGEVKHFSYWNCDVPGPTVNFTAKFLTTSGDPLINAHIYVQPVSGPGGSAHGYTDSLGQVSGPIPANMNLVLHVMSPCNTVMYSQNIGPFSSNIDLGTITINNNPSVFTVEGKLLDCNGAPVSNGFAIIRYFNWQTYASTDASGNFSSTFTTCAGMPATCEIYGVDVTAQQQGATVNVTVASPVTSAGNITACGTSSLEYINYTIDGVSYSFSSLVPTHDINGFSIDSSNAIESYMSGIDQPTGRALAIQFKSPARAAGVYPLTFLYFDQSIATSAYSLVHPFDITITNYPQATGQFFEGSLSGQFKMNVTGVIRNISCSFRVRRQ